MKFATNLNLENVSKLFGVKTPLTDTEASSKKYIDDKFYIVTTGYWNNEILKSYDLNVASSIFNQGEYLGTRISYGKSNNMLFQSTTFSDVKWIKTNFTGATSAGGFTNSQTSYLCRVNSVGGNIYQYNADTVLGYSTFSIYAKRMNSAITTTISLRISTDVEQGTLRTFTLTDEWQRIWTTENFTQTHTTKTCSIIFNTVNGTENIYNLFNAQLNYSSKPLSIVSTLGSQSPTLQYYLHLPRIDTPLGIRTIPTGNYDLDTYNIRAMTGLWAKSTGTLGSISMIVGNGTQTGYLQWNLPAGDGLSGTRLGYMGMDTANITLTLENSAKFVVTGGITQLKTSSTNNILECYDSSGTLRSTIGYGGQTWILSNGAEVGRVIVTTPANSPGIMFLDPAGSNRNQIWSPGGGQGLRFSSSSTSSANLAQLTILPSGNVGIGTDTPSTRLEVQGSHVTSVGLAKFKGLAEFGYINLDTTTAISTSESGWLLSIAGVLGAQLALGNDGTFFIRNRLFASTGYGISLNNANKIGLGGLPQASQVHISDGNALGTLLNSALGSTTSLSMSRNTHSAITNIACSDVSTSRPNYQMIRTRGTVTSPTICSVDDIIGDWLFASLNTGNTISFSAGVFAYVDSAPTSNGVPMRISFVTGSNSTDRLERLTIKYDGKIGINNTSPTALLDINASTTFNSQFRLREGNAPTTPNNGDIWNDSTQKTIVTKVGGNNKYGNYSLFTQVTPVNIVNTSAETSMFSDISAIGSRTIFANNLSIGKTFKIKLTGFVNTNGGDTQTTLSIKFGSVTLISNTGNLPNNLTNKFFETEFIFTILSIGTTGTIIGQGRSLIQSSSGIVTANMRELVITTPITINSTIDNLIDVTYKWNTADASNSVKITNSIITIIN